MRYFLLILLGLSLPVLADQAGQQQGPQHPSSAMMDVEPPCDPEAEIDMPPFN